MLLTQRKGLMSTLEFRRQTESVEFQDFLNEFSGYTMDLFNTDTVEVLVRQNLSDLDQASVYSIRKFETYFQMHSQNTNSKTVRDFRAARARMNMKLPSNETYAELVAKRAVFNTGLIWNPGSYDMRCCPEVVKSVRIHGNEAALALGLSGNEETVLISLARYYRSKLRDLILELHDVLPGIKHITVSMGTLNQAVPAIWSVSVFEHPGDDQFDRIAKARVSQLDDVWEFSSRQLEPTIFEGDQSIDFAINAWLIPVNTRGSENSAPYLSTLGVVHTLRIRPNPTPQPPISRTSGLKVAFGSVQFKTSGVNYQNAELITSYDTINPKQDLILTSVVQIDPGMGQIFETPGKQPFSFDPQHDPPNWLRLHLSNDRAAVEIECDPQSWAKGYLIQLWSDQAEFSTALELPIRKITVPFKEFGLRTKIRATVLNFTSDMLVRSDALGTPHVIRARELAASALETKSVTRDQLIALKPGETLEFGPNLRWVKK